MDIKRGSAALRRCGATSASLRLGRLARRPRRTLGRRADLFVWLHPRFPSIRRRSEPVEGPQATAEGGAKRPIRQQQATAAVPTENSVPTDHAKLVRWADHFTHWQK